MGTLKEHIPVLAIQMAGLSTNGGGNTCTYKDLSGASFSALDASYSQNKSIWNLIPVATGDTLDNYNFEDYVITAVGTTTYTTNRTITNNTTDHLYNCHLQYNVSIQNNGAEDITVNCIRFKKTLIPSGQYKDCLLYSYYLSEPLTISPSDIKSVIVDFCVSN